MSSRPQISNIKYQIPEKGFTVVELMVVLVIFATITGIVLANYAGLRTARNLKIAQNELVTNLRKISSYTLSSRAINGSQAVQFYLLKLDTQAPGKYTIEAIYDVTTSPKLAAEIETIYLPQGIQFSSIAPFVIDRPDPNIDFPNTIPPGKITSRSSRKSQRCY
jgi:prepilin-type N-terminal cleavage/methylation domain-containing protein